MLALGLGLEHEPEQHKAVGSRQSMLLGGLQKHMQHLHCCLSDTYKSRVKSMMPEVNRLIVKS